MAPIIGGQEGKPSEGQLVWRNLLIDWISIGFTEELFWSLTLRQIDTHFRATERRWGREATERRWDVWHIAALPLSRKFPSFGEFVKQVQPAAEGSLDERMRRTAAAMKARARG